MVVSSSSTSPFIGSHQSRDSETYMQLVEQWAGTTRHKMH